LSKVYKKLAIKWLSWKRCKIEPLLLFNFYWNVYAIFKTLFYYWLFQLLKTLAECAYTASKLILTKDLIYNIASQVILEETLGAFPLFGIALE